MTPRKLYFRFTGTATLNTDAEQEEPVPADVLDSINRALSAGQSNSELVTALLADGHAHQISFQETDSGLEIRVDLHSSSKRYKHTVLVLITGSAVEIFVCPTGDTSHRIALNRVYCDEGSLNAELLDKTTSDADPKPLVTRRLRGGIKMH